MNTKKASIMKATLTNGERVLLTDNTRNLGHGLQIEVLYSDGSKGWEHEDDLIDRVPQIIVSFHIGRGGKFYNSGFKKYIGEKSFKDLITLNDINLFISNRDEKGRFIKPIYVDSSGNMVSDDDADNLTGTLNFDGDFDTYIAKTIEDCTDNEIDLIIESNEWKSTELQEYLKYREK